MVNAVKGAGFRGEGNTKAWSDPEQITNQATRATKALRAATKQGMENPGEVVKGLNPAFSVPFGMALQQSPGGGVNNMFAQIVEAIGKMNPEVAKNISLTSPLATGFVPYDLAAPARLIYPVYTPMRNKIPRVQGQGTSKRGKVVTGVSGSNTPSGAGGFSRITIADANLGTYPATLPNAGTQSASDINVPYQFMGLSESVTWLAQFAGQGYDDASSLANLILLQEMMLNEEAQMIWGTGTAIAAPAVPTFTVRNAGSNETALAVGGAGTDYYVSVTARNVYGETVGSTITATTVGVQAGKVCDVTIAPVRGADSYSIYISVPTVGAPLRAALFILKAGLGGQKFTIEGTMPTSGANPPAADTGTAGTNDFEGMLSIMSGHAVTDASVYPAGFQSGYINQSVGDTMNVSVLNTALTALWDGPGAFRASPAELICEGGDARRLADSLALSTGSGNTGYRLMITQDEVGGMRASGAVSEFVNPVTRDIVKILVHPWLRQGTAMLQSYTLPQSWSNTPNVWEMTMVQDYLSVAWPVIDPAFRYSIFAYGSLIAWAAQYTGLLQGLQVSAATPYS